MKVMNHYSPLAQLYFTNWMKKSNMSEYANASNEYADEQTLGYMGYMSRISRHRAISVFSDNAFRIPLAMYGKCKKSKKFDLGGQYVRNY